MKVEAALAGKTVVITRTAEQQTSLHNRLRALGAIPLACPAIAVVAASESCLAQGWDKARTADWLVLPSPNAIRIFCDYARARHGAEPWPAIAALGAASAALLRENYALEASLAYDWSSTASLTEQMRVQPGDRVAVLRSGQGPGPRLRQLESSHCPVDVQAIYRLVCDDALPDRLERLREGFDAVTFASPSSVRCFMQAVGQDSDLRQRLARACIACLGPATRAAARACALATDVMCPEPTEERLVRGLQTWFARRSAPRRLR